MRIPNHHRASPLKVVAVSVLAMLAVTILLSWPHSVSAQAQQVLQPPANLTATMTGQKTIVLLWTAAGSGNGYLVERSENGRTGWDSTMDMTIPDLLMGTFRDDDMALKLSTTYYYRVSTTATIGDSVRSRPSDVANARTGPVEVPGAPTMPEPGGEGAVAYRPVLDRAHQHGRRRH